jgi:hypothetical protein
MKIFDIILILIILAGAVGIVYVLYYNKLSYYKTRIEKAENIIDDNLRKKYDLICKIDIEIKKKNKKDYLKEYIELKDKRISNYDLDRKLIEALNLIAELMNDNSKLNTKEINSLLKQIEKIDIDIESGKNYYNKNNTELNSIIRKFPSNVVAKIHRYKIMPYFDGKNMQDAVVDDFKL